MDAIALIDGTGRWWNEQYRHDMAHSFCSQMRDSFAADGCGSNADYQRGPSFDGYYFNDRARRAVQSLLLAKRQGGARRLFLAGYSRGASIAITAAAMLAMREIPVDGLFLFDPVTRMPPWRAITSRMICRNVRLSRTAYRNLDQSYVDRYAPIRGSWRGNPIRPEFGKFEVAPICSELGDHQTRLFTGSHGAMGGVGWLDVEEDAECQRQVADWMNSTFEAIALNVRIEPRQPHAEFKHRR